VTAIDRRSLLTNRPSSPNRTSSPNRPSSPHRPSSPRQFSNISNLVKVKTAVVDTSEKENTSIVKREKTIKQRPVILKRSSSLSLSDSPDSSLKSASSYESLKSVAEVVNVDLIEPQSIKSPLDPEVAGLPLVEQVSEHMGVSSYTSTSPPLSNGAKDISESYINSTRSTSLHSASLPEVTSAKEVVIRRPNSLNDVIESSKSPGSSNVSGPLDESSPRMIFVFTFTPFYSAKAVSLTGNFDDWGKSITMVITDDGSWYFVFV
jgi:hypothetical protein